MKRLAQHENVIGTVCLTKRVRAETELLNLKKKKKRYMISYWITALRNGVTNNALLPNTAHHHK